MFYLFSLVFKKKNHSFIQEGNLSEKVVVVDEELDGIDINEDGNLEDSPRLVLFDEECGNLIVVNNGGELTRNINQKKRPGALQYSEDDHYVTK